MSFTIKKRPYCNSLGQEVSKDEYESELTAFHEKIDKEYNRKLDELVASVPLELSVDEKLRFIFSWLVNNIEYDHDVYITKDGYASCLPIPIYNNWGVNVGQKYGPIFLKKTICSGIVPVVNDLCSRLGIEAFAIRGDTRELENGSRLHHIWNVIMIDGVPKHFDVVYGIYNREDGKDPFEFCLVSDEELQQVGPHCNYDTSLVKNSTKK